MFIWISHHVYAYQILYIVITAWARYKLYIYICVFQCKQKIINADMHI